jgi:glycosyltransferase involved in cell wall biosynthesis
MFCGGQGIYAANIARELQALGHEVHVISGPPLPDLEAGIELHEIPNLGSYGLPIRKAVPALNPFEILHPSHLWELALTRAGFFPEIGTFTLRVLARWKKLVREHPFDVVLDNQALGWGLLGIQACGVPVVGMVHHPLHIDRAADYSLHRSFRYRWKRTIYRPLPMQEFVTRRLSHVLTVSEASKREIERYFGVTGKNVSVVYNGTDAELFRPYPCEKETDLIFVGRTDDRKKGIVPLLEAYAKTPERVTLKIVDGRIGPDSLVMTTLRRLGIEARVRLVRRMLSLDELVREYSTARAALVPSFFEGFGFPASEAMACGLAVIATGQGALPEVVGSSGEAGVIVEFGDREGLARAMTRLADDPEATEAMGRAARRRVQSIFRWSEAGQRTEAVLLDVVRAHRQS